jgi:hypothetical protein
LPRQKSTWHAPRSIAARTNISAHKRTPFILTPLQLLNFFVGVDIVVSEACLRIVVLGWLRGDGAEGWLFGLWRELGFVSFVLTKETEWGRVIFGKGMEGGTY